MTPKKVLLFFAVLILLTASLAIIYYLARADFHATGVFWDGAITGFAGCLFAGSLTATILLVKTKGILWKKRGLVLSILASSGLVAAIFYLLKPGDSDVWWYGVIAGFLGCLLLVSFAMIGFLIFELKAKERI